MKNIQTIKRRTLLAVALGLLLSLLVGNVRAAAGKNLWPNGTKPVFVLKAYGNLTAGGYLGTVKWPIAPGAHHYRLRIVKIGIDTRIDQVVAQPGSTFVETMLILLPPSRVSSTTYAITVIAYSGPNEAKSKSEAIQTTVTVPAWGRR